MKKIFTLVIVLSLVFGLSLMAGKKEFKKGSSFLTGEFGFNSFSTPFGISYEMGIKENIGVGATVMFQSWGYDLGIFGDYNQTLITPSVFALYHFNKIKVKKLDVSAGASIGFSIYSSDWEDEVLSGGLFVSLIANVRYYFSKKWAVNLKETYSIIGDWSSSYTMLGVTYRLK